MWCCGLWKAVPIANSSLILGNTLFKTADTSLVVKKPECHLMRTQASLQEAVCHVALKSVGGNKKAAPGGTACSFRKSVGLEAQTCVFVFEL